jgi:hypothetical protein
MWLSTDAHGADVESLATRLLEHGAPSVTQFGNHAANRHVVPTGQPSAASPAPATATQAAELDVAALWQELDVMVDDAHTESGRLNLHVGTAVALISVISVGYVIAHLRHEDWSAHEN